MVQAHAKLAPSGAHRWLACPGSVVLEASCPDESNDYADEGTAAHALAAMALTAGNDARAYLGCIIQVGDGDWEVTADMAGYVQLYIDYVRALGGELMVEQRLPIAHLTGEAGAEGTSDAVVLLDDELVVVDLKYGRGVRVDAEGNEQLQIYAAAALREFGFLGDFRSARLVIVQPRLGHISEWVCGVSDLQTRFAERVKHGADRCFEAMQCHDVSEYLAPGDSQCRFCKAKAICPALTEHVLATVADDFVDVARPVAPQIEHAAERIVSNDILANLLGAVDLVESWCRAIRARAESELLAGRPVPGYKLVEGRRGARKWADEKEVEAVMKAMRLRAEEMYDFSLISPTAAEKLHKSGIIGPRQWAKLQALITQSEGKPSVAPESDKRPALVIQATADEFALVTDTVEGLV